MRTLTLGVLIVSGGTLAALPFRRQQAIPDASVQTTHESHVTGPTFSDLEGSMLAAEQIGPADTSVASGPDVAMADNVLSSLPSYRQPRPTPARPRRIDIPLTYEDLEQPIDQPPAMDQRFNATVEVHAESLDAERVAGLEMPAMETLAVSQQEQLQRAAASVQPLERDAPAAQLASSAMSHGTMESLPAPTHSDATRQRHWIRQP